MDIEYDDKIKEMFDLLSLNEDINFRFENKDEEPLTVSEKYNICKNLFDKSPGLFLQKFYKYLKYANHGTYFESLNSDDSMVLYYLRKLKCLGNKTIQKNRRFKKLLNLIDEGKYFSHEQMKERQPLLYDKYIGNCITDKEQEEKLGRCYDSFSGFLMNNMLYREDRLRRNQESIKEQETLKNSFPLEASDSEEEDEVSDDEGDIKLAKLQIGDDKNFLEDEFLSIMKQKFLNGEDEFDYSDIDDDSTLDDLEEMTRDFEDKYFDEEDPSDVDFVDQNEKMESDDDFIEYNARDKLDKYLGK